MLPLWTLVYEFLYFLALCLNLAEGEVWRDAFLQCCSLGLSSGKWMKSRTSLHLFFSLVVDEIHCSSKQLEVIVSLCWVQRYFFVVKAKLILRIISQLTALPNVPAFKSWLKLLTSDCLWSLSENKRFFTFSKGKVWLFLNFWRVLLCLVWISDVLLTCYWRVTDVYREVVWFGHCSAGSVFEYWCFSVLWRCSLGIRLFRCWTCCRSPQQDYKKASKLAGIESWETFDHKQEKQRKKMKLFSNKRMWWWKISHKTDEDAWMM